MKAQTDYFAILDIIKQNFIISTLSILRINIKFIRAF